MSCSEQDPEVRAFRLAQLDGRTTKSSKLPQILRDLEKTDPMLYLDLPGQGSHKNFEGTNPASCTLSAGTSQNTKGQSAGARNSQVGPHLTFKISGGVLAKAFTISAKVASSAVSNLRQSQLRFFLGERGQVKDFAYTKQRSEYAKSSFGGPTVTHIISWTTCGGFGSGLDVAADYDEESADIFKTLKGLTFGTFDGETAIHLVVADAPGLSEQLMAIKIEAIKYNVPWWPYLDDEGRPLCSWAKFPKRADVKIESGGLSPIPAQNSFATIDEAHVILANGICLEYRESPKHDSGGSWPYTAHTQLYLKTQLVALDNLENAERWWPIVLNQATEDLPLYDPLVCLRDTTTVVEKMWSAMEKVFPWDEHQQNAIWSSRKLRGRVGIIEGGPGSGKTLSLAAIAVSYACSGFTALLFAPTVSQAIALGQAVTNVIQRLELVSSDEDVLAVASHLKVFKLYAGEADLKDITENPHHYRESLGDADIVIALPYAICSEALVKNFGSKTKSFLMMHDDAHQFTESEIWGTVLSLAHREKCKGLIMATDVKEWPLEIASLAPLVRQCVLKKHRHQQLNFNWMYSTWHKSMSRNGELPPLVKPRSPCKLVWVGGNNEFAAQVGITLVSRLLRQGFPSVMLKGQHRFNQQLASRVNAQVYKANPLAFLPAPVHDLDIERFHGLLRHWLGPATTNKNMSVIFLEASQGRGQCIKEGDTNSRRNHRNVDVVYDLVVKNARAQAINVGDIKIVTQYKDQTRLYEMEYQSRRKESGMTERQLPQVLTLDLLRGQQTKVVIYDLVATCGDESHALGIHNNEFRTSLAVTRACDTLIIVGSHELLTKFPEFWTWKNGRTGCVREPLPMIVRYAEELKAAGLSFKPPTPIREPCDFVVRKQWVRLDSGFFGWEWVAINGQGQRE